MKVDNIKEEILKENKHKNASLIISTMQINMTMTYHLIPTSLAKVRHLIILSMMHVKVQ